MKVFLFFLVNIFFANPVISNDCMVPLMSVEYILKNDLVFRGKVIGKEIIRDTFKNSSFKRRGNKPIVHISYKYLFRIKELIRGVIKNRQVVITSSQTFMTGSNFEIGDEYYIYANLVTTPVRYRFNPANGEPIKIIEKKPIEYYTHNCTRNIKSEKATIEYKNIIHQYGKSRKLKTWKNIKDQVIAKGKIRKRIPVGNWTFYHDDGKISKEGAYLNGEKEGLWKYYIRKSWSDTRFPKLTASQKSLISDPSNILIRTEYYVNGVRKKKEEFNEVED